VAEQIHYITLELASFAMLDHHIVASVDKALCVGIGPCFLLAPRAFELGDDMKARVLDPSAESEESLLMAAQECPTQAIYLSRHGRPLYP
jgi:ferredoxin